MNYARHPYFARRELWLSLWPKSVLFVLSMIQFWFTWMIIGLETWNAALDYRFSFAFVGYIASIFFTLSWIATTSMVCCHRDSYRCAQYTISSNVVSIVAACVLIYFDSTFIENPSACLSIWENCTLSEEEYLRYRDDKVLLIRVQLSFASVFLTSNVIFALMYLIAMKKTRCRRKIFPAVPVLDLDDGSFP